ncbi:Pimeloyl-[acyl-carrier protein] methyl ester esterase [Candidatus Providencia siddallii]|uniref:Pimeloyl-[acyl-carrier protein] methyl ester esterase n=1 Tax=Candidatus Providencia siddallii TaxID=1715285 RepID=A0A0M6W9N2_9GAMM|nr:Pimeloyl-[acyl-carrier protein] methyl ester esterase [Candidatus Providencia siddallii]
MSKLYWKILGKGSKNIVLLHGWGLTSQVWNTIIPKILDKFRIYLVDLPGYGKNRDIVPTNIKSIADIIWENAPKNSIWLGWSLGGLVASRIALDHPQEVIGLITVASSPYFVADNYGWPGISKKVLFNFEYKLVNNFQRTAEQFLILQTLGTKTSRNDFIFLKNLILKQQVPKIEILNLGLTLLRTEDLRDELKNLSIPFLRVYGYLDNLVPRKVSLLLDKLYPNSLSIIMRNSAHAPFISHPDEFCRYIYDYI